MEFEYRAGLLTIRHEFRRFDHVRLAARAYQAWLLSALLSGGSLDRPPIAPSMLCTWTFLAGLFSAAVCAVFHFLPEEIRGPWVLATGSSVLASAVIVPLFAAMSIAERRWRSARSMAAAGGILVVIAAYFWLARQDAWQITTWRTSNDPEAVCRAGLSAYMDTIDSRPCRQLMSKREDAAFEARAHAQRRIAAMGAGTVPALLRLKVSYPHEDWCDERIARIGPAAIPSLIEGAKHCDREVRTRALRCLAFFPQQPETKRVAIEAMRDREWYVRNLAIDCLIDDRDACRGSAPRPGPIDPEVERVLLALLDDRDLFVQCSAIKALGYCRSRAAIPRLMEMTRSDSQRRRCEAAMALGAIGDPVATPVILDVMLKYGERLDALDHLGSDVIDPVLDRLTGPEGKYAHRFLRSESFRGLESSDAALQRLLGLADDTDAEVRATALWLLARCRRPEAIARAKRAMDGREAWCVVWPLLDRRVITEADIARVLEPGSLWRFELWRRTKPEHDAIADKLREIAVDARQDFYVRRDCIDVLQRISPGRLRPHAPTLRSDPELAIFRSHFTRMLPTSELMVLLASAPDADRRAAALELGERRIGEAVPALCEAVRAGDDLRDVAIAALGALGDNRARAVLRDALAMARAKDAIATIYSCAIALGTLGDRDVIPLLRHIIRRPSDSSCGNAFRVTTMDSIRAIEALTRFGEEGAVQLLEALEEDNATHRIAEAIGKTGSARGFERLIALLDSRYSVTRRSAALGLGHLGDRRSVPHLRRAMEDPSLEVVEATAWALERLTGADFGAPPPAAFAGARCFVHVEKDGEELRKVVRAWFEKQ